MIKYREGSVIDSIWMAGCESETQLIPLKSDLSTHLSCEIFLVLQAPRPAPPPHEWPAPVLL